MILLIFTYKVRKFFSLCLLRNLRVCTVDRIQGTAGFLKGAQVRCDRTYSAGSMVVRRREQDACTSYDSHSWEMNANRILKIYEMLLHCIAVRYCLTYTVYVASHTAFNIVPLILPRMWKTVYVFFGVRLLSISVLYWKALDKGDAPHIKQRQISA